LPIDTQEAEPVEGIEEGKAQDDEPLEGIDITD